MKVYRDNLRAIGCPEPTVRVIILSEINELFVRRRHSLLATLENRFWEFARRGEFVEHRRQPVTPEWQQPLEKLVAERQEAINQVLGKDHTGVDMSENERLERRYAWLPAEKRAQFIALESAHAQKLAEWAQWVGFSGSSPTGDDQARLEKLQQDFMDAQSKLLTPAELDELRLRDSGAADWAGSMPGFDPTEDEWRAMTGARMAYEDAQRNNSEPEISDEQLARQQNEIESNFKNQLKAALGEDRFAEYQRASNDQFQEWYNVTERYGLPESLAMQAYGIQQAALAAANQVQANPNLSADERQSAWDAIRRETERTLSGTLGATAFSTYQQYNGTWFEDRVTAE